MIVEDAEFNDEYSDEDMGGGSVLDPTLFAMLKELRKDISRKHNLPGYVIFQDVSLEQMAMMYPVTVDELQNIQGVGMGKARRYGREFCELIKKYCDEHEIERPEELRVRTVPKKSSIKVSIIKNIDKKVPLDAIADAQNLEFEDLLREIEAIVESGTKLDISYFIEDVMDTDQMECIYDYFRESETGDVDEAVNELGDELIGDNIETDIRLVRIKFLSEMAN